MVATANIMIVPISNGYVVSDASGDPYGGSEWNLPGATHYATLDDLAADMPRFVTAAVEGAVERARKLAEQLAAEEQEMRSAQNYAGGAVRGQVLNQRIRTPGLGY